MMERAKNIQMITKNKLERERLHEEKMKVLSEIREIEERERERVRAAELAGETKKKEKRRKRRRRRKK